jgi:hypothetical protein
MARPTVKDFEGFQERLLVAAREYERARRPLLRAHFATHHPIGCECSECIAARVAPGNGSAVPERARRIRERNLHERAWQPKVSAAGVRHYTREG